MTQLIYSNNYNIINDDIRHIVNNDYSNVIVDNNGNELWPFTELPKKYNIFDRDGNKCKRNIIFDDSSSLYYCIYIHIIVYKKLCW